MLTIHRDTEQLVRLVAVQSGTTPEEVVRVAIEEHALALGLDPSRRAPQDRGSAEASRASTGRAELIAGMELIAARSAARPSLDARSIDEILDYDDRGVPR